MGLMTTKINGIELDVYYSYDSEDDPYGTGDSPTAHYVEIIAVEVSDSTVDIKDILPENTLADIEDEIIDQEN